MKTCSTCKIEKPLTEFHKHTQAKSGFKSYCRACAKASRRRYHVANYKPGTRYYEDIWANAQRRIESGRNADDCRRMYEKHRAKRLVGLKIYKEANKERVSLWKKTYKWRVRGAEGICTNQNLKDLLSYWGEKCWICKSPYEEIDHVKPVSKGGSNWPVNLRPICGSCNKSKSNKWPLERVLA